MSGYTMRPFFVEHSMEVGLMFIAVIGYVK